MKNKIQGHPLRRRLNLLLHRWHRRIGIVAAIFLVWMAVSGWLLNHTDGLDLAHRNLTSDFITAHYGIRSEIPNRIFIADDHWLAVGDDAVVLDGKKISLIISHASGMVAKDNILFIAERTNLILLDASGELIDKVTTPLTIDRIGLGCGGVVVADTKQQKVTRDGATFADCSDAVMWSHEKSLTQIQRTQIEPLLRTGVTLERVLLDLHSGRFFGTWGPFFVDLLGLGFVMLALSGAWLFLRHRRQRNIRH